jgi:hypothetical protein
MGARLGGGGFAAGMKAMVRFLSFLFFAVLSKHPQVLFSVSMTGVVALTTGGPASAWSVVGR